ncbi:D-alanyl-D-alanine carboxypeptidase/D-alanyl-D-alanine-endopeptidase (penicillin-binding protein 4) [Dysgonomonas sp. PH5-45]|uniref:D-alanyl-D-alanine carboxypeptidase/D-alanyl-D-alanine endopeptidase n=1 Tax=unclassified Dysgonomonas TaxID=2630389 RepID=UPI0024753771|nr:MULTISPECIES: D-alanyl-D-alanine carboxypeptidase/D-alanyl-D-alanine-endopeptidase [unclassified Dysgonomonas]MDH6355694.1 D-alanyl-D-alanine carboxypeptidase/D-alanyl-D-alanine-endopeptidase (penicillin-binding protein 4) [Dysgonomonas sp. PH5-45]MDH6388591.1 D-alanyl-D-alanine carboxypeptidase/D-alanyl-D-alanine-endopeptidase (penicillin-binding protein 4) [Dysgonomonas sp. PH5-37]
MRYILAVLWIMLPLVAFGQAKKNALEVFVSAKGFENANLSVCVKDESGKTVHEYNSKKSLTPASVLKALTTATAMELLGADFRFKTELYADRSVPRLIIVKGYGDPTLGSEYISDPASEFLNRWVAAIKEKVNSKSVQILVDDSYFGYKGVSSKWIREDLGNYFAAGAYGISVFDNTYRLVMNTVNTDSCPRILRTEPAVDCLKFTNMLQLNKSGQDNGYICGEPFSCHRLLMGDIPAAKASFSIKGDIPDPGLFLGQTLAANLNKHGYEVQGVRTQRREYLQNMFSSELSFQVEYEKIYTHQSPPLWEIVKVINFRSNNHFSEHLIRAIGRVRDKKVYSEPLNEGVGQIKSFWKTKGLDVNALFMYDGCGLSPSNAVSSEFLCSVLSYMQRSGTSWNRYYQSFPAAGKEGTVRGLLKGSRLEGKVKVKSGSIAGVQCYAGYYFTQDKKYSFVVMVNNFTCPRREAVKAIENLLLGIF